MRADSSKCLWVVWGLVVVAPESARRTVGKMRDGRLGGTGEGRSWR